MGDVVTVQEVSKTYRLGKPSVTALAGVSLRVAAGDSWPWPGLRAAARRPCST
jgi:hypothetical protein